MSRKIVPVSTVMPGGWCRNSSGDIGFGVCGSWVTGRSVQQSYLAIIPSWCGGKVVRDLGMRDEYCLAFAVVSGDIAADVGEIVLLGHIVLMIALTFMLKTEL